MRPGGRRPLVWFARSRSIVADDLDAADGRFAVDIVLAGDGRVEGDWGATAIRAGDAFATPAAVAHRFVAGTQPIVVIRSMGPAVP